MFSFLDGISAHWVLIGSVLVINAMVSATKRIVRLAKAPEWLAWFINHLSPILFGVGIAAIPGVHVDGVEGFGARAFFFASAGLGSAWLYRLARQYATKQGYTLESEPPGP